VIAQAKNGEGKTLAYSIPLIEKIDDSQSALDKGRFYP
jgi:superfamily II DNA/RNA helicase